MLCKDRAAFPSAAAPDDDAAPRMPVNAKKFRVLRGMVRSRSAARRDGGERTAAADYRPPETVMSTIRRAGGGGEPHALDPSHRCRRRQPARQQWHEPDRDEQRAGERKQDRERENLQQGADERVLEVDEDDREEDDRVRRARGDDMLWEAVLCFFGTLSDRPERTLTHSLALPDFHPYLILCFRMDAIVL